MDRSRAKRLQLVAAILIADNFSPKNPVMQKREDVVEREKVHVMSD